MFLLLQIIVFVSLHESYNSRRSPFSLCPASVQFLNLCRLRHTPLKESSSACVFSVHRERTAIERIFLRLHVTSGHLKLSSKVLRFNIALIQPFPYPFGFIFESGMLLVDRAHQHYRRNPHLLVNNNLMVRVPHVRAKACSLVRSLYRKWGC